VKSMSEGFKTIRKLLEEDLEFEKSAVKTYSEFAERIEDVRISRLFQSLAEDEAGHVAGITAKLNKLKTGEAEVSFYCPRCEWTLNFGKNPNVDDEVRCPMCGMLFRLVERDGDYDVEEIEK